MINFRPGRASRIMIALFDMVDENVIFGPGRRKCYFSAKSTKRFFFATRYGYFSNDALLDE
jgi:hypothetical protein